MIGANLKEQKLCRGAMENNSRDKGKVLKNTFWTHLCYQCSHFIPPENTRKPRIFKCFPRVKMGRLPRQGLPCRFSQAFSSDCALILESIWNFCNDFGGRYFPVRSFQAICEYSQSGNRIDQLLWSWLTLVFRTTWSREKGHCNLPITVWALSQNL